MAKKFKIGDRIICVDLLDELRDDLFGADIFEKTLTLGNIYTIIDIDLVNGHEDSYPIMILNDYGLEEFYGYNNFESLIVYRDNIINNILNGSGI